MFHVVQVVAELFERILERRPVAVLHLRPAGQSWLDRLALFIERNLLGELVDEKRPFRPRPDETHIAAQDVPQLRKLVETCLTDETADACHPTVLRACPDGRALFGILAHRAKLVQGEEPSVFSNAFLAVEDR